MGITLFIISLFFENLWVALPSSPYFASPSHTVVTFLVLFAGGLIAFCMVWAEFALIASTSALTFMVAGTFKEIVTVGAAVIFLHEEFTLINASGLIVLVAGVVLFNYLKYQKLRERNLDDLELYELGKQDSSIMAFDPECGALLRVLSADTPTNVVSSESRSPRTGQLSQRRSANISGNQGGSLDASPRQPFPQNDGQSVSSTSAGD